MRKFYLIFIFHLLIYVFFSSINVFAIALVEPSASLELAETPDYASEVLQDPWDMSNREDISQRMVGFRSTYMKNGVWRGRTTSADAHFWFLWGGDPGAYATSREGARNPINTRRYNLLTVKMYLSDVSSGSMAQFYQFYRRDLKKPVKRAFRVKKGWNIYRLYTGYNLKAKPISLRLDPIKKKNVVVKIDWIRLSSAYERISIKWHSDSSDFNKKDYLYIDNDRSGYNGMLRMRYDIRPSKYTYWNHYFIDSMQPGKYYLYMKGWNGNYSNYSPVINIKKAPIVKITDPDEVGGRDWASTALRNSWNMSSPSDISQIANTARTSFARGRFSGVGKSPHKNDPFFLLNFGGKTVDAKRFHRLTFRYAYSGGFSLKRGTMSRIGWTTRRYNSTNQYQMSDDVVTYAGWNTYTVDLKKIHLNRGSYGWKDRITRLRFDPHEDPYGRRFYVDYVTLREDDATNPNGNFVIRYKLSQVDGPTSVSFYRDRDRRFGNGNEAFIKTVTANRGNNRFTWKPSKYVNGNYYIYARAGSGALRRGYYSSGPLKVVHNLSITANAKTIKRGSAIRIAGRVVPGRTTIALIRYKKVGSKKWRTAKRVRITKARYRARIRLRSPGKYIFMTRVPRLSSRHMAIHVK
ncbi:hypothetical protein LCGC14_1156720 [marine sediment metagenome]|uniref:Uncharacterized protein n=1 Tax=marine sediment metagenome TaxID=412755 RepID=A0A0F9PZC6_9ZZZZ